MLTTESLTDIIKQKLHATEVEVQDMSGGCGQAFAVIIVSNDFINLNKLARHRLVNKVLADEIAQIHAFTQKVFTVEEWETQKKLFNQ